MIRPIPTLSVLAGVLAAGLMGLPAGAQTPAVYPDGRGGEVLFPLGDISFADEVVSFTPGDPASGPDESIPEEVLGPPDYVDTVDDNYLTLGCGGVLELRFTDNALVDVDGPDLFIFEIGPAVEATELAISGDGEFWVELGRISGAVAAVDLAGHVDVADSFSLVRLTDLRETCHGQWPGADIDAVGAIGAGRRVVLDSSVLFDVDHSDLRPEAEAVLAELAADIARYGNARLLVEGHTDDTGSDAYNQQLSVERASSVGEFLIQHAGLPAMAVEIVGYGESRPTVPNDSDENRTRNRRVEVVIVAY